MPNAQTAILVVDDDPINLLILAKTLEKLPHTVVHHYTQAQTALTQCQTQQWDLVVVDYQMPQINGLAFARAMRQMTSPIDHTHTPVLMVTASSDPTVKHELLELGVVDFLNKPLDPNELIARARNLIALYQMGAQLRVRNARLQAGMRDMTDELAARERETLWVLAKVAEYRDNTTAAHLRRMAAFSRLIALQLGLGAEFAHELYLAAPMHDVGKVGIPDHVLLKPGRLDASEWEQMRTHPTLGHELLGACRTPILRLGGQIAWCHHEAWDGSGYPRGLAGEAIPLVARIVAVADVFDALTSVRPYKRAWSTADALAELHRMSGIKLDPQCVAALAQCITEIEALMQEPTGALLPEDAEPNYPSTNEQYWLQQIEALRHESQTDVLTGLGNRRYFEQEFARLYELCRRSGQVGALVLIDINQFKSINDRFGHSLGDRVLSEFGRLTKPLIRPYECFARIGGDEFALITAHSGEAAVTRLTHALGEVLSQVLLPSGEALGASFGHALMDGTISLEQVYAQADAAMYQAKSSQNKSRRTPAQ